MDIQTSAAPSAIAGAASGPEFRFKLLFSRQEAANALGISLRTLDYYIAGAEVRVRRIGGRVLVSRAELQRFASGDRRSARKQ